MAVDEARVSAPPVWRSRRAGDAAFAALLVSTSAELVAFDPLGSIGRVALALVAFCSFGVVLTPAMRDHALTLRRVIPAIGFLVLLAVVVPPRGSHDIWSYAAYGRLLSIHHVSPFTHVPAAFPHDALLHLVGRGWRHTGSVYGPGFAGLSALGTALTGPSVLATRLFFQVIEAAGLVAALVIVWRRTRDPIALAFIGLNPALIAVVNGGHNDILVGLALLGGTLLLVDNHPRSAGGVLALGALIKLVLVLPVGALVVWAWRRRGARSARDVCLSFAGIVVGAYVLAGGTRALQPLLNATTHRSRSSIWQLVSNVFLRPLGFRGRDVSSMISTVAIVVVAAIAIVVVTGAVVPSLSSRSGRRAHPTASSEVGALSSAAAIAAATMLVFLLGASYTLPWYSAWVLPLVALVWRQRVALVAAVQAAVLVFAYAAPTSLPGPEARVFGSVFSLSVQGIVPILSIVGLGYLAWSARRGRLTDPVVLPAPLGSVPAR